MDAAPFSLVLVVSTGWAIIFRNARSAPALRLDPSESLRAGGAWVTAGLCAPMSIRHWYFIFAFLCLVAWFRIRHERYLSAKIWLAVAAALGLSLGVVFLLQADPSLAPDSLPPRGFLLLLASIYLGGAVTGLAYAAALNPESSAREGPTGLLVGLGVFWLAVVGGEVWLGPHDLFHPNGRALLLLTGLVLALSFAVARKARPSLLGRPSRLFQIIAALALVTGLVARWLTL